MNIEKLKTVNYKNNPINILIASQALKDANRLDLKAHEMHQTHHKLFHHAIAFLYSYRNYNNNKSDRNKLREFGMRNKIEFFNVFSDSTIIQFTAENHWGIDHTKIYVINNEVINQLSHHHELKQNYEFDESDLKDVLAWLINKEAKHTKIYKNNYTDIDLLIKLWQQQAGDFEIVTEKTENVDVKLQKHLKTLLKNLHLSDDDYRNSQDAPTVAELIQFQNEFLKGELTIETQNVQTMLSQNDVHHYIEMLLTLDHADRFFNIEEIDYKKDQEINSIIKRVQDGLEYDEELHVKHVYKFKNQADNPGKHHITLMHGTNQNSVPSIVLNGLLNHRTLNKKGLTHEFAGESLGAGVYFTHPDQASRSLAFGNNGSVNCMFVADVAYNTKKQKNTYDFKNEKADLVIAPDVGYRRKFTEYVATRDQNIRLKYLIISE